MKDETKCSMLLTITTSGNGGRTVSTTQTPSSSTIPSPHRQPSPPRAPSQPRALRPPAADTPSLLLQSYVQEHLKQRYAQQDDTIEHHHLGETVTLATMIGMHHIQHVNVNAPTISINRLTIINVIISVLNHSPQSGWIHHRSHILFQK